MKKAVFSGDIQDIVVYKGPKGAVTLRAQVEKETLWATLNQIADLFGRDKSVISRHITDIYRSGELSRIATVAKNATVQKEGKRMISRTIEYYNLDVILSVGYRVNSKQATAFRIWATETLREYLLHGYVLNRKALIESKHNTLRDLEKTVSFIQSAISKRSLDQNEIGGILQVVREYAHSFLLLDTYDRGVLENKETKKAPKEFLYTTAQESLAILKSELMKKSEASDLFAKDRGDGLASIIGSIHQSFGGESVYASIELRAAHLLYFVVKNHPFFDGNKRSGAFLFIRFLHLHRKLTRSNGEKVIADTTLVALTLLVAESDPKEKDQMISLITQLIA